MKKILIILLLIISLFSLNSCSKEIPEGEVKNYIMNFDYDKAYKNVKSIKSVIESKTIINDEVVGSIVSETNFINEENDKYYYLKKTATGSYYGKEPSRYEYYSDETLSYLKDNNVIALTKQDGTINELKYTNDDLIKSITNTFYLKLESGFHTGGIYYGDYIMVNAGKFYNLFSITEDNLLKYNVNVANKNDLGEEIVTMHSYTVDSFGIIKNLETKSINKKTKEVVVTTINVDVNCEISRIWEL